jgi:hypothetical protein
VIRMAPVFIWWRARNIKILVVFVLGLLRFLS